MRKLQLLAAGIVLLSFITAFYFQPSLPSRVAIHWDLQGNANGYSGSAFAAYFMPVLSLAMLLLFMFLPTIDPLKKNYAAFRNEYDGLMALLIGFLYYVYVFTIAVNIGYQIVVAQYLAPAFAVLFFYLGMVLAKAKQNWFVGIRTPWTLSSESVWNKTHAIVSKLFKTAGVVALIGIFLPKIGLILAVAVVLAAAVFAIVYSYLEFEKEKKRKKKK